MSIVSNSAIANRVKVESLGEASPQSLSSSVAFITTFLESKRAHASTTISKDGPSPFVSAWGDLVDVATSMASNNPSQLAALREIAKEDTNVALVADEASDDGDASNAIKTEDDAKISVKNAIKVAVNDSTPSSSNIKADSKHIKKEEKKRIKKEKKEAKRKAKAEKKEAKRARKGVKKEDGSTESKSNDSSAEEV